MTTSVASLAEMAAEWRMTRRIYPIYSGLTRSFDFGVGPCRELESPIDRSEPEVLGRVNHWFASVDERVEVHQLRKMLQTTHVATEENLRDLLLHQLSQLVKTQSVRDKVDYLCVQYYTHCANQDSHLDSVHSFAQVAELLCPILGDHWQLPTPPDFAGELEELANELRQCTGMGDLMGLKIIQRGREIKDRAGEEYFSAPGLIAFTRFNFLIRRGFFRLMHSDLHAIRVGLQELEHRGIKSVDCSAAGLSANEPIGVIREVSHDWKTPFRAAYDAERNFGRILGILKAVTSAVWEPRTLAFETSSVEASTEETSTEETSSEERSTKETVSEERNTEERVAEVAAPVLSSSLLANSALRGSSDGPPTKKAVMEMPLQATRRLDECLEEIAEKLFSARAKNASRSLLMLGMTKLELSSWEIAAFVRGGNDVTDALQRAVAARALIQMALDEKEPDDSGSLCALLGVAHAEAAGMQEIVAEAKDANNIDGAVNLAATAKRLLEVIEQAEKAKAGLEVPC